MEDSLRKTFNQLFVNYMQKSISVPKSFIYICDEECMNSMYGYGLTSAFLIAVLSDRRFFIYPNKNSPFYRFYDQNQYHWKRNATSLKNRRNILMVPRSFNKHRQKTDLFIVERDLFKMDFDSLFKEDIVYHYGNEDWVLDLRRHPKTHIEFPWLYQAHASDVVRLIHNGLFRVPKVAGIIHTELIKQVGGDNLVCFSGNMEDKYQLHGFLDFFVKRFKNESKMYVSGVHNAHAYIMTYMSELDQQLVEIGNKEIHKHFEEYGMQNRRLNQHLIDIQVLQLCHVLVLSENPSGILAAQLRREESHIYCYRNSLIFPCTRRLLARSFNDVNNQPEHIDAKYFCKLSPTDCNAK